MALAAAGVNLPAQDSPSGDTFQLRAYRGVRHTVEQNAGVTVHRFFLDDAEHARWFASKIYSDYSLTLGNTVVPIHTKRGPVDAISLQGQGLIVPLIENDSREVDVLVGGPSAPFSKQLSQLTKTAPMRNSALTHPLYMDKWDRYCLGAWMNLGDYLADPTHKTVDEFYKWMGEIGLNPQINSNAVTDDMVPNDAPIQWMLAYLHKYGVKYQRVEWLANSPDLYNRNPFLTKSANPHVATRWNYYGEVRDNTGPLRDAENASFLTELKRLAGDPNQMAILDADGEIGPFQFTYWGASGPMDQRAYTRFLREVRGLSLDDVSLRYLGKAGMYKSWEDVPLPDWRTFFGWTDGSVDLAGEWRFMRDEKMTGDSAGWAQPSFDDSAWVRLYYPGDALVDGLVATGTSLWMRKTVTVPESAFPGKAYLSVAPLSMQAKIEVFVNGQLLGTTVPYLRNGQNYGQFDITGYLAKSRSLTVALRLTVTGGSDYGAPSGPIFLTSKPIEDYPTSDPLINAQRWDISEFVDWATSQGVGSTLSAIRSVDPDRPIKVHAYGLSPWGWKTVAEYGGFSHHTGSGAGWTYTEPHQLGESRDLQDSSETGGSMDTERDVRGLFGNLIFMGKNAFDYFHDLQSITKDPVSRAYFVQKMPDIKVMGRVRAVQSPVAEIKGMLNWQYLGETAHWEEWRYDPGLARGGEMTPCLDEVRIREGNLNGYSAIVDPGTQCWDDAEAAALRAYVEAGGVLLLDGLSGQDTFIRKGDGAGPGATLAGVRLGSPPPNDTTIAFLPGKAVPPGIAGTQRIWQRRGGWPSHSLIPQAGVDVVGTWPDGSPAFTRTSLGKGAIYYCGGSTYPANVVEAFAAAYGTKEFATVEKGGGVDLVRTLRGNNGCEDFLMLRGLGNKPAVVHWTFDYPPKSIYNPVTGKPVAANIDGNTATFTVNIPDWDFSWFAARRPDVAEDFSHWFTRQTQMWSGYTAPVQPPEVPLFRHFDLNHGWKLAQTDSVEHAKALMPLDDNAAGLVPTELLYWNTPGMKTRTGPGIVGFYRKDFDLPAAWARDSILKLALGGRFSRLSLPGWAGPSTVYVNGSQVWNGDRLDAISLDVTSLLKPVHNRIEIVYQGIGIMPSIMLERSAVPDSVIDLSGTWRAVDAPQHERDITLPGAAKAAFLYRDIDIPASAGGQDVWIRVDGSSQFVVVNGRVRYWDTGGDDYMAAPGCEIDISPDIRPGAVNRIALGTREMFAGWRSRDLKYNHVDLAIYRPGKWSADGKSNRDALTPAELERVRQDLGVVQLYPMNPPAKPGAPAAVTGTSGTNP